jgi:hypothetical protein
MNDIDHYICPQCGDEVRVGGAGCPKCNRPPKSRERKSWEQDEARDGLDLPDDPDLFDYEQFLEEEFGGGRRRRRGKEKVYWVAGIILLGVLFYYWVLP